VFVGGCGWAVGVHFSYSYGGVAQSCSLVLSQRIAVLDLGAGPCVTGRLGADEEGGGSAALPDLRELVTSYGDAADGASGLRHHLMGSMSALVVSAVRHLFVPDVKYVSLRAAVGLGSPHRKHDAHEMESPCVGGNVQGQTTRVVSGLPESRCCEPASHVSVSSVACRRRPRSSNNQATPSPNRRELLRRSNGTPTRCRNERVSHAARVLMPLIVLRNHQFFDPIHPGHPHSLNLSTIRTAAEKLIQSKQSLAMPITTHELRDHERLALAVSRARTSVSKMVPGAHGRCGVEPKPQRHLSVSPSVSQRGVYACVTRTEVVLCDAALCACTKGSRTPAHP